MRGTLALPRFQYIYMSIYIMKTIILDFIKPV